MCSRTMSTVRHIIRPATSSALCGMQHNIENGTLSGIENGVVTAHDSPPFWALSASAALDAVGWMAFESSMCLRIR